MERHHWAKVAAVFLVIRSDLGERMLHDTLRLDELHYFPHGPLGGIHSTRGIPCLNITRRCRQTAKEVNNTIIKSAPSGACWSAPLQLPTGSTGVACRQAHSGRMGWCPKIESATADRRRYGSPVIRNTYQTVITNNDLNHQL